MSGHSKWETIRRKKGALDAKRGQLFTRISKAVTIAAQNGGGDPDMNFTLRLAIEKAKEANMPKDNIDRAIKKGLGELGGEQLIEISYEGYGPVGTAAIVDVTTDNKNRTAAEIRHLFEQHGGSLGSDGAVSWQFEEKGLIMIKCKKIKEAEQFGKEATQVPVDKDETTLELFDIEGVEDVKEFEMEEGEIGLEIYCTKVSFASVNEKLVNSKYVIISSELVKIPTTLIELSDADKEKVQKFIEDMESNEDVQNVWINTELD